jgi:hypothetical protein
MILFRRIIIVLFILFPELALSQTFQSITGIVTDAKTEYPIENVNVFLAYSMMGAATDKDGYYIIPRVPKGTFDLVVSHINYHVQTRSIRINKPSNQYYVFKLVSRIHEAPPIIINAETNEEWQRNFKKFKDALLGKTENAKNSKILNPLVLYFSENESGDLIAKVNEPLHIENKGLGYTLYYILRSFVASDEYIKFSGIPKFAEIEIESNTQKQDWMKNREKAYKGSFRHFISSICANYRHTFGKIDEDSFVIDTSDVDGQKLKIYYSGDIGESEFVLDKSDITADGIRIYHKEGTYLKQQGFDIWFLSNIWLVNPRPIIVPARTNRYLRLADIPTEMYLKFPSTLKIIYSDPLLTDMENYEKQHSLITLEKDSVLIDIYGRYHESFMIKMSGHWAKERLADTLPYEYEPEENNK